VAVPVTYERGRRDGVPPHDARVADGEEVEEVGVPPREEVDAARECVVEPRDVSPAVAGHADAVVVARAEQVVVEDVVGQHHLVGLRRGVLVVEDRQLGAEHEAAELVQLLGVGVV
jgi:hypothetical protein